MSFRFPDVGDIVRLVECNLWESVELENVKRLGSSSRSSIYLVLRKDKHELLLLCPDGRAGWAGKGYASVIQ